jgi:hypothetical protein
VFSEIDRDRVEALLLERAARDPLIVGVALTGGRPGQAPGAADPRPTGVGRSGPPTRLIENTAPAGSARTAVLPIGMSNGATTARPPASSAADVAASTSWTQKSTPQRAGPSSAAAMVATTSRETGCSGSPPT